MASERPSTDLTGITERPLVRSPEAGTGRLSISRRLLRVLCLESHTLSPAMDDSPC